MKFHVVSDSGQYCTCKTLHKATEAALRISSNGYSCSIRDNQGEELCRFKRKDTPEWFNTMREV